MDGVSQVIEELNSDRILPQDGASVCGTKRCGGKTNKVFKRKKGMTSRNEITFQTSFHWRNKGCYMNSLLCEHCVISFTCNGTTTAFTSIITSL